MFLQVSVCPQRGGGVCLRSWRGKTLLPPPRQTPPHHPTPWVDIHPRGRHPPGRHPPGQTTPGQTPPGQTPPWADTLQTVHAGIHPPGRHPWADTPTGSACWDTPPGSACWDTLPGQCMLEYTPPVHAGLQSPLLQAVHAGIHTPPWQCMLGYTPSACWNITPRVVHAGMQSTSGQYAFHWNAFLLALTSNMEKSNTVTVILIKPNMPFIF